MQETPKGAPIPVPKREDVMRDLRKVAKPIRPSEGDTAVPPSNGEGSNGRD